MGTNIFCNFISKVGTNSLCYLISGLGTNSFFLILRVGTISLCYLTKNKIKSPVIIDNFDHVSLELNLIQRPGGIWLCGGIDTAESSSAVLLTMLTLHTIYSMKLPSLAPRCHWGCGVRAVFVMSSGCFYRDFPSIKIYGGTLLCYSTYTTTYIQLLYIFDSRSKK